MKNILRIWPNESVNLRIEEQIVTLRRKGQKAFICRQSNVVQLQPVLDTSENNL